jgi:hypothetical protein
MAAYTRNRIVKNEVNCGKATSNIDMPIRSQARLSREGPETIPQGSTVRLSDGKRLAPHLFTEGDDIVHTHMKIWDTV